VSGPVAERESAPLFPLTRRRTMGYRTDAVDAFLNGARASYESTEGAVTSQHVRSASFPLSAGGYDIAAVDRALVRLEDALARRERAAAIARGGAEAWIERARALSDEILAHLDRPPRRRFDRTNALAFGYNIDEVDTVALRIRGFLRAGTALSADQVRTVAFRMQRGGYREEQVDALLDATVAVILAVR